MVKGNETCHPMAHACWVHKQEASTIATIARLRALATPTQREARWHKMEA